jgi:hypothetical protein
MFLASWLGNITVVSELDPPSQWGLAHYIRRDGYIVDFARGIVDCEREYQTLNEILRKLITFQQFVSFKNPSWSKDEVTHWVNIAEKNRARGS